MFSDSERRQIERTALNQWSRARLRLEEPSDAFTCKLTQDDRAFLKVNKIRADQPDEDDPA